MNEENLRRVLDELEKREMPLLSWGVTDGSLTEAELEELVRTAAPDEDTDEMIDELLARLFIVEKGLAERRYRSRMAETVRLATKLRQWFPRQPWTTAPSLVSDSRFLSRARTIPRRDTQPNVLADRLRENPDIQWTPQHDVVMNAILAGRSVRSFQARAMERLVQPSASPRGTVVTAGTGAGKTLAFYLPALTRLLANPAPPGIPRVVAIYPRIELLRDQLATLLQTSRALASSGVAPPNVGVLYGAVPRDRSDAANNRYRGWARSTSGLVCPILSCPEPRCGGNLVWPTATGDTETLICDRCGSVVGADLLTFTRNRLRSAPPAILFTTTEMVNLQLASGPLRRLLVGDGSRSPEFILLDEVHTYSGTHGAQVANLLRRWRAELAVPPHIVGLSATLADPVGFFSELTGLGTSNVSVVAPEAREMKEVGREYFLALRGDAASQTSLLSTTIQASMLMRRMLDPTPAGPSGGAFGSKLFVFLDDLDDTHRLHAQLEDAEGWRPGGVNRKPGGSLATLRASAGPDLRAREENGQVWDTSERLGTLQRLVRVSRTTSRDQGVDADADVVVATASLEVGVDDPTVGAVLQHKAPRDPAQFIQRRGRAGRDPLMRPWTVVVLSDFGRDRLAFQSYEALFEPVVPRAQLPLRNRTILKMQATWWLLDYLGRYGSGTSVLSVIERPWDDRERQRQAANRLLGIARDVLTEAGIERLSRQLQRSFALNDEDLRAVIWDHPRALVPAVLATLIRRLEAVGARSLPETFRWAGPLGEFLPTSLFAPLQTPEIQLTVPWQTDRVEAEPVSQGLRQFAPGRVSYRYALRGRRERLWVTPPPSAASSLAVEDFCDDYVEIEPPPNGSIGRIIQPMTLRLASPPPATPDSSYGRWDWRADFRHDGVPLQLDRPAGTPWAEMVSTFEAMTHRHRCQQTVWRYAETLQVERNRTTEPPLTQHDLTLAGEAVCLGFAMDVDGLRLIIQLPTEVDASPATLRSLRVARMEFVIRTHPRMAALVPSVFTREWLHQVLLSVIVTNSTACTPAEALESMSDAQLQSHMVNAAREVFGAIAIGVGAVVPTGAPDPGLVADLSDALRVSGVIDELRSAASALWIQPNADWLPWLRERQLTTLAAGIVDAIQSACPEADTSDLRCDIESISDGPPATGSIRITEDEPGGIGVIETFVDRYVEDPRGFWALVAAALSECDGERVDRSVRHFLAQCDVAPISNQVSAIRTARDLTELTAAWTGLRAGLFERGIDADQAVVAAIATRIVRPGSTPDVEGLVGDLLRRWDELEESLGVDVELRVFAYLAATDSLIRRRLQALASGRSGGPGWEVGQIVGLLWPRGYRLRAAALQTYSPYRQFEPTERLLFADVVGSRGAVVDAASRQWRKDVDDALRVQGSAVITARSEAVAAAAIRDLMTEPTSVDVLEFHPRVVGVSRSLAGIDISLELREAYQ